MDVFAALADPVRRDLLRRLARGPLRVVDLAAGHDISRPAISRHLRVLGDAGLVGVQDVGRERHYRLAPDALQPVADLVNELSTPTHQVRFDASALDGLDLEVRRTTRDRERTEAATPGSTHTHTRTSHTSTEETA